MPQDPDCWLWKCVMRECCSSRLCRGGINITAIINDDRVMTKDCNLYKQWGHQHTARTPENLIIPKLFIRGALERCVPTARALSWELCSFVLSCFSDFDDNEGAIQFPFSLHLSFTRMDLIAFQEKWFWFVHHTCIYQRWFKSCTDNHCDAGFFTDCDCRSKEVLSS